MIQDKLDPRQIRFLELWLDPKSSTFGNCKQSAISAKYDEEYADQLSARCPQWLKDNKPKLNLVKKAERNLDALLDGEDDKIKADLTKFTLSRLNKAEYSERQEHTGSDGSNIVIEIVKNTPVT